MTDHYSIAGMHFAVRTTRPDFSDLVRRYLAPFETAEAREDVLYSAECGRETELAGGKPVNAVGRLYLSGLRIFEGIDRDQMAGRLIGSMRDKITSYEDQFVRLRAGAVVLDGEGLIMPSSPDPRLAALVAMLVRSGAEYLGDELVHLDPVLRRVTPTSTPPLPILINESDLPLFPELNREPARRRRSQREEAPNLTRRPVRLAELNGRLGSAADVRWIAFPYFVSGAATEFQPMSQAQAFFRLSEAVLNLHIWGDRTFALIRELLASASVARLNVGSLPEAAELLRGGNPALLAG